jgi:hypothetical protein
MTVTITDDRAANLDLCLALTAFSSGGSFTCQTYCDTEPPFLKSYPKDPWFSLLNVVLLTKEQSLPILNVLGLTGPAWARLELNLNQDSGFLKTASNRMSVIRGASHSPNIRYGLEEENVWPEVCTLPHSQPLLLYFSSRNNFQRKIDASVPQWLKLWRKDMVILTSRVECHCTAWVQILQMRSHKPRSRVTSKRQTCQE